jgi:hypothetical protein
MLATFRLIRTLVAAAAALGLIGSGVCSPLLLTDCAIAREVSIGSKHCCCGDNCRCGSSCGEHSQRKGDKQPATSVERDLRVIGKVDSSAAWNFREIDCGSHLISSGTFASDAAGQPQTLLAQHTFLRV